MFTFFVEAVFKLTEVSYAPYKNIPSPLLLPASPLLHRGISQSLWDQPPNWLLISEHLEDASLMQIRTCEGDEKNSGRRVKC